MHDLKKKFDYRPVRAKVKELIKKIQAWTTTPQEQCFLYEIIMNELSMHKGMVSLSKKNHEKMKILLIKKNSFKILKNHNKALISTK